MIQGGRSGVGRYVIELAGRLAKEPGLRLHVAGLAEDRRLFATDGLQWHDIPARWSRGAFNFLWHQAGLPGLLRREGIDLLHVPSYRRLSARPGIPQVATIHDCAPFVLRGKYDLARRLFGTRLIPPLARRCKAVIAVSEATAADLRHWMGLAPDRLQVIHNGIDHDRFRPPTAGAVAEFRRRQNLPLPFFLYLARIEHPGKNHLRLIEAFDRCRSALGTPCQLLLGGTDWHGAEVVHAAAAAARHAADIRFAGFVADGELPLWYAAAEALVMPSLAEGFGLPVAEAMACGTPVLSSNRGSLPEVGGDAARYFDPLSVEAMAGALVESVRMPPDQRQAWIDRGLANAARFSWTRCAALTADLYRRLVS